MAKRDFLSIDDLSIEELGELLDRAAAIKDKPEAVVDALKGKQVALIFEKPSTRTRVSFEVAVTSMGGHPLILRGDELQIGRGETVADTGTVLSRFVDCIVIRTFGHDRLKELAAAATVPVVNALSDFSHPCQALADMQTIIEQKKDPAGLSLAYVGDGNNVAHSLMFVGTKLGMHVRIAAPEGHAPEAGVTQRCAEIGAETGGSVTVTNVVAEAVTGADVLYTDVWASMGQEAEAEHRQNVFKGYSVDRSALDLADGDAIVMHCLPAHRGEEISADAIDGPQSVVWDQAENRMHAQKALLEWLLA
ncbi:MAG: ornithine carbamoyltransferase [Actinobacteria bacterium]|nr:ornithine carbamoyltransferase [Actinomycetota bacterium]